MTILAVCASLMLILRSEIIYQLISRNYVCNMVLLNGPMNLLFAPLTKDENQVTN